MPKFAPLKLKKNHYFIRERKPNDKIAFIFKGCMICVYNNDGIDVIEEFSTENEFITDYYSLLMNIQAEKDIK